MPDLVSLERVKQQVTGVSDAALAALVAAASGTVERYCRRVFWADTYDELIHGSGDESIFVDNPPIRTVKKVRTQPLAACFITNTDSLAQTATVDVTATGVTLTKTRGGVTVETDFPFETYPTFTDLVAGIDGLGSGWSAVLNPRFAEWACSDLRPELGSFSAKCLTCSLTVHWYDLSGFRVNPEAGEILTSGGFPPGFQSVRVQYEGGYTDIPDDLQHAVCELVQLIAATKGANPLMQSETLDRYSYTRAAESAMGQISWVSKQTLQSYRQHKVARHGAW